MPKGKTAKTKKPVKARAKARPKAAKPKRVRKAEPLVVTLDPGGPEADQDVLHAADAEAGAPAAPTPEADDGLVVTLADEDELDGAQDDGAKADPAPQRASATAWGLPDQFLLVALREGWDQRMERAKAGRQGAALVASLLLELALRKRVRLHLDRLQLDGAPVDDPDLEAFAQQVAALADRKAGAAMQQLARRASHHIAPWRGRLAARGIVRVRRRRVLGLWPRLETTVADEDAKAKVGNRLQRTLVGGTPDVRTILLLGLIDAAGLLPELIPAGALAYNRRRVHALLNGRDPLGYRVDPGIHALQAPLVELLLRNVRNIQGTQR